MYSREIYVQNEAIRIQVEIKRLCLYELQKLEIEKEEEKKRDKII